MPVRAIHDHYQFAAMDLQQNYGDNLLIYVGWDEHTLFCSAQAMLVSPEQSFADFISQNLSAAFSQHPEFTQIDWDQVQYSLDGKSIQPHATQHLADLGVAHKSLIRFKTPGLRGYGCNV
ncbi:phenol hydroxylase subunit P4 [Acinetobacter larvae]|uniref:Phenol hydroxylase n=1 Tax=Acinetobacter larvae TaxID=1789224 RepID=A0A1B2M0X3_9GAMM|nr:phenol hydroxylase subunit P4 [Acinetobacter larvae]AOA58828.1 phenol hydroxylase [Acinetobacter larvae]